MNLKNNLKLQIVYKHERMNIICKMNQLLSFINRTTKKIIVHVHIYKNITIKNIHNKKN